MHISLGKKLEATVIKKLLFFSFCLISAAIAKNNGYEIFQKKCQHCHAEIMTKNEVIKHIATLKAPPMIEVASRLRDNINIVDGDMDVKNRVMIAFIKDYIDNPNLEYSMCDAMALEKFGVMPSQKGKLTENEKESVAKWIVKRYTDSKF